MGDILGQLEQDLGLPDNWCLQLIKEEPWSFVIKLHAVIEASITHLLNTELDKPGLREFIEPMALGGQFGKLMLARKLGLLGDSSIRFITELGALRNACVHGVKNIAFRFDAYLAGLADERRKQLVSLVRQVWIANTSNPAGDWAEVDASIGRDFRIGVFLAGLAVLAEIARKSEASKVLANANRRILAEAEAQGPRFRLRDALKSSGAFSDHAFGERAFGE